MTAGSGKIYQGHAYEIGGLRNLLMSLPNVDDPQEYVDVLGWAGVFTQ